MNARAEQIAPPSFSTSSAQSAATQQSKALPSAWIDRLFERLGALYGDKFAQLWAAQDIAVVRDVWAEGLAGLTGEQVAQGLRACMRRPWPPTLPEFRALCLPDPEGLFTVAMVNARASALAYWTLQRFGYADAKRLTWEQARERWTRTMHEVIEAGVPELPLEPKAIAYEEQPVWPGAVDAVNRALDAKARHPLAWAQRIVERVERGERVAPMVEQMAREALA